MKQSLWIITLLIMLSSVQVARGATPKEIEFAVDGNWNVTFIRIPANSTAQLKDAVSTASGVFFGGEWDSIEFWNADFSSVITVATGVSNLVVVVPGSGAFSLGNPNGRVNDMDSNSGYLYVGGNFTEVDGLSSAYCARLRYSDAVWLSLAGLNGEVLTLEKYDIGKFYAGGRFTNVSGYSGANYLARWSDPNPSWIPVETGISGPVVDIWLTYSAPYYDYLTE